MYVVLTSSQRLPVLPRRCRMLTNLLEVIDWPSGFRVVECSWSAHFLVRSRQRLSSPQHSCSVRQRGSEEVRGRLPHAHSRRLSGIIKRAPVQIQPPPLLQVQATLCDMGHLSVLVMFFCLFSRKLSRSLKTQYFQRGLFRVPGFYS